MIISVHEEKQREAQGLPKVSKLPPAEGYGWPSMVGSRIYVHEADSRTEEGREVKICAMHLLVDWHFWLGWLAIDAAFVLFIWWMLGDLREALDLWAYKHVRWYRRRIIRRALVAWVMR